MCYMLMPRSEVGVRELRQNLSVYLDRVKRGETLTVTGHRQVVAILRPADKLSPLERLVAEGRATPATRRPCDLVGGALPRGRGKPFSQIIDENREDII